jgi:PST family polysaccharide transporter
MALLDYRYWSLVGLSLATEVASFLLTGMVSRWKPQLPTRGSGIGPMLTFGAHQTAGSFMFSLASRCDNVLIGRFYGPAAVGVYSRAAALVNRPIEEFLLPIGSVFLPTLSRLQSRPERYRSTFLRLYEAIAMSAFFFSSLLLALATPITLVLLGPKWTQVGPIFAGFTLTAVQFPLGTAANWLLTSQGRGKDILRVISINSVLMLASFIVGLPFGPLGVALAFSSVGLLVRMPILYYVTGRSGPVSTSDLWTRLLRHLPLWVVMLVTTWSMHTMVDHTHVLAQLVICASVGMFAGVIFICMFQKQRTVATDILDSVRELTKKV